MKGDVRRRGAICITINDFEENIDEQRYRSNFYADQPSGGSGDGIERGGGNSGTNGNGTGGNKSNSSNSKTFPCCPDLFGKRRRKQKFNRNYGSVNCSNFDSTNREG